MTNPKNDKRRVHPIDPHRAAGIFPIPPTTTSGTNATSFTIHLEGGHDLHADKIEHGPLCWLQERLWKTRVFWAGNLISDFRYWLWRLCR